MVEVFICKICGDAYIGEEPTNCPFCGANHRFMLKADNYDPKINDVELSEADVKHLNIALQLELRATQIYLCSSEKADTYKVKKMFKRLARIEGEHASVISKILKAENKPGKEEDCSENENENIDNAYNLETNAVKIYQEALKEVTSARVVELFTALVEVETDHQVILKR